MLGFIGSVSGFLAKRQLGRASLARERQFFGKGKAKAKGEIPIWEACSILLEKQILDPLNNF